MAKQAKMVVDKAFSISKIDTNYKKQYAYILSVHMYREDFFVQKKTVLKKHRLFST